MSRFSDPAIITCSISGAVANREDGASELHIGKASDRGWEWLGPPLLSANEAFRHAEKPGIAFIGERPVVAWTEELHADMAGVFASEWTGSSWRRLGALTSQGTDYFLTPALAVDQEKRIWLSWGNADDYPWVVRWNGSSWVVENVADLSWLPYTSCMSSSASWSTQRMVTAADQLGRPHILFASMPQNNSLTFEDHYRDSTGWHVRTFPMTKGTPLDMVIDAQGTTHILAMAPSSTPSTTRIVYIRISASAWN